jgi:hypothetical protein
LLGQGSIDTAGTRKPSPEQHTPSPAKAGDPQTSRARYSLQDAPHSKDLGVAVTKDRIAGLTIKKMHVADPLRQAFLLN